MGEGLREGRTLGLNSTALALTGVRDEITLETLTGSRLPVLFSCCAIELAGQQGVGVVFTDISTRKQAERQILRLNRLYAMSSAVNSAIATTATPCLRRSVATLSNWVASCWLGWACQTLSPAWRRRQARLDIWMAYG